MKEEKHEDEPATTHSSTLEVDTGSSVTGFTESYPGKETCHYDRVCADLYHELKAFVRDDTTLAPEPKLEKVQEGSCPVWPYWYFGITLALALILIICGASLGCRK